VTMNTPASLKSAVLEPKTRAEAEALREIIALHVMAGTGFVCRCAVCAIASAALTKADGAWIAQEAPQTSAATSAESGVAPEGREIGKGAPECTRPHVRQAKQTCLDKSPDGTLNCGRLVGHPGVHTAYRCLGMDNRMVEHWHSPATAPEDFHEGGESAANGVRRQPYGSTESVSDTGRHDTAKPPVERHREHLGAGSTATPEGSPPVPNVPIDDRRPHALVEFSSPSATLPSNGDPTCRPGVAGTGILAHWLASDQSAATTTSGTRIAPVAGWIAPWAGWIAQEAAPNAQKLCASSITTRSIPQEQFDCALPEGHAGDHEVIDVQRLVAVILVRGHLAELRLQDGVAPRTDNLADSLASSQQEEATNGEVSKEAGRNRGGAAALEDMGGDVRFPRIDRLEGESGPQRGDDGEPLRGNRPVHRTNDPDTGGRDDGAAWGLDHPGSEGRVLPVQAGHLRSDIRCGDGVATLPSNGDPTCRPGVAAPASPKSAAPTLDEVLAGGGTLTAALAAQDVAVRDVGSLVAALRPWANQMASRLGWPVYLVGSAIEQGSAARDIDVVCVMPDESFTTRFGMDASWYHASAWMHPEMRARWNAETQKANRFAAESLFLPIDFKALPQSDHDKRFADKPRVRLDTVEPSAAPLGPDSTDEEIDAAIDARRPIVQAQASQIAMRLEREVSEARSIIEAMVAWDDMDQGGGALDDALRRARAFLDQRKETP